jgi:hypothetical protein
VKHYNFKLAIGGNINSIQCKTGLPACEVHILAAIHGEESITELVEASSKDKVKVEHDNYENYLKTRYRKRGEKGLLVDVLFLKGTSYEFPATYKSGDTVDSAAGKARIEIDAELKTAKEALAKAEKEAGEAKAEAATVKEALAKAEKEITKLEKTADVKSAAKSAAAKAAS